MNWANEKYYDQIVNGYYDQKTRIKKYKQPTVNYLFTGLNYAINNFDEVKQHQNLIIKLIFKWLIKII